MLLSPPRLHRDALRADLPWGDRDDWRDELARREADGRIDAALVPLLTEYLAQGAVVLRGAVSPGSCEAIWQEIGQACGTPRRLRVNPHGQSDEPWYTPGMDWRRLRFLYVDSVSPAALQAAALAPVARLMQALHGGRPVALKVAAFPYGSGQAAHADMPFMPLRQPLRTLVSWLACERITAQCGPVFYHPGSHRWPWHDFGGGNVLLEGGYCGTPAVRHYEAALAATIEARRSQARLFTAEAGDLIVWHPLLVHGGLPVADASPSRRSLVCHYGVLDEPTPRLLDRPVREHGPISYCAWRAADEA